MHERSESGHRARLAHIPPCTRVAVHTGLAHVWPEGLVATTLGDACLRCDWSTQRQHPETSVTRRVSQRSAVHRAAQRRLGIGARRVYAGVIARRVEVTQDPLFEVSADRYREEFLVAVEATRTLHDPSTDWVLFRDTLWAHLARVFGVDFEDGWPDDMPDPTDVPVGDARAVAGWLHERGDGVQRSAAISRR
jgi:hypothetical protein